MRTLFHPFLPNGPHGDPALWIDLFDEGRSLLLDLGELSRLSSRKLMRVERVVVTHTHLDHFIGFDQLLRLAIVRERELVVSGPPGFVEQLGGRIAAYSWNVIESYPISIVAEELDGTTVRAARFCAATRMEPRALPERTIGDVLWADPVYSIRVATLDHGIPVLAVALHENERIAVDRAALERLGLVPGAWLRELKRLVREGAPEERRIVAEPGREVTVGEIARAVLRRRSGQQLVYCTDFGFSEANVERVLALADRPDLIVCEAAFLHRDRALAAERHHLTARQAGELAQRAGARRLALFHHSSRYERDPHPFREEAAEVFDGELVDLPGRAAD